jgi:hypothetical protein
MRRQLRATLLGLAMALLVTIPLATPASAATSQASVWYNDKKVASIWFNSGTHNMSVGRNSFTLKVESGASWAGVRWWIPGITPSNGTMMKIYGSGAERSWSVAGAQSSPKTITYLMCAEYWGKAICGPVRNDTVR